ncbi:CinA family protein [Piscinibacter sakaiensis]|uniref:C-terminal domain of CinA type S n=1 Tax=Piscinibacter sakaiensis TaxID=1547922 RepID=A0A0K8P6Y7_PISS1|nr:CinA family protein [Piscinibacter sakaiensis]GAP38284.1 C-terminal domain of CinA type S [Piscinibacter sakaiensis]
MDDAIDDLVARLAVAFARRGERMVTAESCTGGLIAAACTARAGSSDWFERGLVTYSNEAKTELLGVPAALIAAHGAVSGPVVEAMAAGALAAARADWSVAVTGIAGPGGAVPGKPVGTVWLAVARRGGAPQAWCEHFDGDRAAVRRQTVASGLGALCRAVEAPDGA